MENLFALTILKVIHLGFCNQESMNPYHIGFQNRKGNSLYVSLEDDKVKVPVFKVSRRCCYFEITSQEDIDAMAIEITEKLKLEIK
jgi:hypothetical protein